MGGLFEGVRATGADASSRFSAGSSGPWRSPTRAAAEMGVHRPLEAACSVPPILRPGLYERARERDRDRSEQRQRGLSGHGGGRGMEDNRQRPVLAGVERQRSMG